MWRPPAQLVFLVEMVSVRRRNCKPEEMTVIPEHKCCDCDVVIRRCLCAWVVSVCVPNVRRSCVTGARFMVTSANKAPRWRHNRRFITSYQAYCSAGKRALNLVRLWHYLFHDPIRPPMFHRSVGNVVTTHKLTPSQAWRDERQR